MHLLRDQRTNKVLMRKRRKMMEICQLMIMMKLSSSLPAEALMMKSNLRELSSSLPLYLAI